MAWIESHQELRNHPKVIRAARALGVSKVTMLGHLHCLWWWALDYAQDGILAAFDAADIAQAAEWEGDPSAFITALVENAKIGDKLGLLEYKNGVLCIHDWWDYAGKLIDKRKTDAERKREDRRKEQARMAPEQPAIVQRTSSGHPTDVAGTVPYRTVPNLTEPSKSTRGDLPIQIRVYLENGGTFPTGALTDGTTKKARAIQFITEHVKDDPASLALWGQVVAGYCAQWSNKSYTVMVNDYYLVNKIPGQPTAKDRNNGNGNQFRNTGYGLASLPKGEAARPATDEDRAAHAAWRAEQEQLATAR